MSDIFEAARKGDSVQVKKCIASGFDAARVNEHGFTALQCAAMGTNDADPDSMIRIMGMLIDAGCPLEYVGKGGRTAFYLCAEFSTSLEPVRFLKERGANVNVANADNVHVIENALLPATKEYIS